MKTFFTIAGTFYTTILLAYFGIGLWFHFPYPMGRIIGVILASTTVIFVSLIVFEQNYPYE